GQRDRDRKDDPQGDACDETDHGEQAHRFQGKHDRGEQCEESRGQHTEHEKPFTSDQHAQRAAEEITQYDTGVGRDQGGGEISGGQSPFLGEGRHSGGHGCCVETVDQYRQKGDQNKTPPHTCFGTLPSVRRLCHDQRSPSAKMAVRAAANKGDEVSAKAVAVAMWSVWGMTTVTGEAPFSVSAATRSRLWSVRKKSSWDFLFGSGSPKDTTTCDGALVIRSAGLSRAASGPSTIFPRRSVGG